ALAAAIDSFATDPLAGPLYCPYQEEALPYQRGDRLIGFLRFDKRFSDGVSIATSVLRNRFQRELYTPELKYNPSSQLGQKTSSWYGSATLDLAGQTDGGGKHLAIRVAAQTLDRYLGAVDSEWLDGRSEIAGFGLSDFRFFGEEFVRLPIDTQLDSIVPVPGYRLPQGFEGSPFGPASEGVFTTEGTSGIANWNRSKFLGADIVGELFRANGNVYRGGLTGKLYEVETYERPRSWLAGSAPNYARFYPARLAAFGETVLKPGDLFTVSLGLRVEGFRSGLEFREDRSDFLAPVISTDWNVNVSPRIGIAGAFENSAGRSAFRANFARVAQPPDFQYFIDNTIGDSLRTDVRRQGNPNLAFEQGRVFEFGASQLFSDKFGVEVTLFYKNLTDIVTGNVRLAGSSPGQYTTGDRGTVKGMELSARGRFPGVELSIGYALMEATGLTSGARNDSSVLIAGSLAEFPLAFDRRHTIDAALLLGRAAPDAARARAEGAGGLAGLPVGAAITAKRDRPAPGLRPDGSDARDRTRDGGAADVQFGSDSCRVFPVLRERGPRSQRDDHRGRAGSRAIRGGAGRGGSFPLLRGSTAVAPRNRSDLLMIGRRSRFATVAFSLAIAGCGDPVSVVGDIPGLMRIVLGVPDTPGRTAEPEAIRSRIRGPTGLALDDAGVLFVVDGGNARVLSITSSGRLTVLRDDALCTVEPCLREPADLALDPAG
ncbi:MAG: hypothetical protein P8049_13295, partial [Gemmatimonadota bacterium]